MSRTDDQGRTSPARGSCRRRPGSATAEESSRSTPPAGDADQVEQDLDALLADAQQERDEYLELAKRTKADFENFRKRMAAEVQAAAARGKAELAAGGDRCVIDNLERALEAAGPRDADDGLAAGVESCVLVYRELARDAERHGIEAVDPKGEKFDPDRHEALSTQPSREPSAGTVVEVMQKGYRLGEQLIRPARVVVSE